MQTKLKKRLVLVGGGHAHLFVLERLAKAPRPDLDVLLISASRWQLYSGMVPGWMAGNYELEQCRIDLRALAARAGASILEVPIVGMDAARRCVGLVDGHHVEYDLVSLDTGSETDLRWLAELDDKLLPVKPLAEFQIAWSTLMAELADKRAYSIAIVGGGAAGVEIALNARRAFSRAGADVAMTLIAGETGLLPGHSAHARRCISRWLKDANIEVLLERAVGVEDGVLLSNGHRRRADRVIAATGPRPPVWLALSKLHLDREGYVAVDACNRSNSHANVFAAGDICARADGEPRSGVHAVRAGPILAHNLLAAVDGVPLRELRPRRRVLHLLADGDQRALLSFGPISASAGWLWRWKDRIDRRFIECFSSPPSTLQGDAHARTAE